jgi:hypothetical protein
VFNNPTRFVDPSGYQLAYSEMPVFVNFGSSNWTYYSSGGRSFDVSKPFGGKNDDVSYDWIDHNYGNTGVYRDTQGNEVDWHYVHENYVLPWLNSNRIYSHITTGGGNSANYIDGFKVYGVIYEFDRPVRYEGKLNNIQGIISLFEKEDYLQGGGGNPSMLREVWDYTFRAPIDFIGAVYDFAKNYHDMRKLNLKNSDKYFHSKANFQATKRGPGGAFFAIHFSNLREMWDQKIKGDTWFDSMADQEANMYGRKLGWDYRYKKGPIDYSVVLNKYWYDYFPDGY